MGFFRVGAGVVILLAANACAPLAVQQSARTVKPGGVQVGMSAGSITSTYEENETGAKGNSTYVAMTPNAWARFGLASNVDAGLQFYGSGVRLDAKFAPIQSDKMAFAIDAGVAGGAQQSKDTSGSSPSTASDDSTDDHQWFGDVGVLFTAALGPTIDLNLAAKYLAGESYTSEDYDGDEYKESTQISGFGGAVAFAFKRGTWTVSPEVSVYQITSTDTETPDATEDTLVIVPSVGFSVGF